MKKRLLAFFVCLSAVAGLSACGTQEKGALGKLTFGDAGWDSMRFHSAVAALVAESAFELETDEISGSTAVTYGALKTGDIDVFMEMWTDNIATYEEDLASGSLKELGVNFDDNIQGLYVPRYVIEGDSERSIAPAAPDLRTVADLKNYKDVFKDPNDASKGRIYGAISGWEVDAVIRAKVKFYGLDALYNYMDPGSDAALSAAISSAYEKGEPVLAYYWEPTWITGKYDLVLLEDAPYAEALYSTGACAFPSIRITIVANPDFYAGNPEFCEFLSKYKTSSGLTSEALAHLNETGASYRETASWFLRQHDELLTGWLSAEKADLVREAIS
ncbi:MAG: ABC transporter substrate-binding protein [Oscillospiraceae bacterium]|jgi:glycine betaine/proline transport system permease protein/glycine betaine/proline transport system substrate-binding protein|nr:ABC transporter substrate-binding protein [Oscillospiraceae bacterium]